jgi:hypothetical protein
MYAGRTSAADLHEDFLMLHVMRVTIAAPTSNELADHYRFKTTSAGVVAPPGRAAPLSESQRAVLKDLVAVPDGVSRAFGRAMAGNPYTPQPESELRARAPL